MSGELVIWHRSFPSLVSTRIDSYLTGDYKPKLLLNKKNNLGQFNLSFNDKTFADYLTFKTGDDICISVDDTGNGIHRDRFVGKINSRSQKLNAIDTLTDGVAAKLCTHELNIQQRDFSDIPFEINEKAVINLSDLLPIIFQEYTRTDLGGNIDGVVIPKYLMLCEDKELPNFINQGKAIDHVTELINNRLTLKWGVFAYSEYSATNGINWCYQVRIWE